MENNPYLLNYEIVKKYYTRTEETKIMPSMSFSSFATDCFRHTNGVTDRKLFDDEDPGLFYFIRQLNFAFLLGFCEIYMDGIKIVIRI